eukprot:2534118-Rhodomonas_salina.4
MHRGQERRSHSVPLSTSGVIRPVTPVLIPVASSDQLRPQERNPWDLCVNSDTRSPPPSSGPPPPPPPPELPPPASMAPGRSGMNTSYSSSSALSSAHPKSSDSTPHPPPGSGAGVVATRDVTFVTAPPPTAGAVSGSVAVVSLRVAPTVVGVTEPAVTSMAVAAVCSIEGRGVVTGCAGSVASGGSEPRASISLHSGRMLHWLPRHESGWPPHMLAFCCVHTHLRRQR